MMFAIGQAWWVGQGGEEASQISAEIEEQFALVKTGRLNIVIQIDGSSEDRAESRAHWRQVARALGVPFRASACLITIGGRN